MTRWYRFIPARPLRAEVGRYRPALEELEGRVVMSTTIAAPPLAPSLIGAAAPAAPQASAIVPIVINSITNTAGQLVANASLGGQNFPIPLSLTVPAGQAATAPTQILNLHLAPIDLNLLGLEVKTSEICLNISAQPGPGNVLGNLLAGVAGALDNGLSLNQILGSLGAIDLNTLTTGLTNLLNSALSDLTAPSTLLAPGNSVSATPAGSTSILHLAVGPVNLDLLGLMVNLDNCQGGQITVDVIAHTGPGNLLGNLLGGLSHLLDSSASTTALVNKLEKVAGEILSQL
jgi:hypothetical protein